LRAQELESVLRIDGLSMRPSGPYADEDTMTSLSKLLAQKQQLLGRLEEDPGPNERAELERLLDKVAAALSSLQPAAGDIAEDPPGDDNAFDGRRRASSL
jgi:hypothetical protein